MLATTKTLGAGTENKLGPVFQVVPKEFESIEWRNAVVCGGIPGPSVCMPEKEYLKKRQAEIENPMLKEAFKSCNTSCESDCTLAIVGAGFLGVVFTAVLFGMGSKR